MGEEREGEGREERGGEGREGVWWGGESRSQQVT